MDAVMVVHQLQRLATASPPSASLAAKLPRVAIGICYFIDHPEVGVRQQAANAVKAVALKHCEILRLTCCGDLKDGTQTIRSSSTDGRSSSQDATTSSSKAGSSDWSKPEESSSEKAACSSPVSKDAPNGSSTDESSSGSERNSRRSSGEEKGSAVKDSGRTRSNRSSSSEGTAATARTEKNLITLLQRHVNSEDSVIRECCRDALQALLYPGKAQAGHREAAAATPAAADAGGTWPSGAAAAAEVKVTAAPSAPAVAAREAPVAAARSTPSPAAQDLSSGPLHIPQHQQRQRSDANAPTQGSPCDRAAELQSSCVPATACTAFAGASSSSPPSPVRYTPVEGELCTVLLGLRGLLQQPLQQAGSLSAAAEATAEPCNDSCQNLEKLRKDLQYRLVRVPGVSSVTITLNTRYLQQQLLLTERRQRAEQLQHSSSRSSTSSAASASTTEGGVPKDCSSSSETGDCSNSPAIANSRGAATASPRKREDEEAEKQAEESEREEGDGVAVLLMRLPSPPKKRLRALQAVKDVCGPLTLVLRATRVYEHRRAGARSRRSSSRCCAPGGAATGAVNPQQQQGAAPCSKEQEEDEAEEAVGRGRGAAAYSAAAAARPTYLDDERQSDRRNAAAAAAGDSRYSSREDEEDGASVPQQKAGSCEEVHGQRDGVDGEGFCGWGPTAAGFSFFSRNSALFSQSRHLRSYLLPYEEDERQIAARLKKEKEMKQRMQRQQAARETVVDRVLSNIGKGLFW